MHAAPSEQPNGTSWTAWRESGRPRHSALWVVFSVGILGVSYVGYKVDTWYHPELAHVDEAFQPRPTVADQLAVVRGVSARSVATAVVTAALLGAAALAVTALRRPFLLAFLAVASLEELVFLNWHRDAVRWNAQDRGVTDMMQDSLHRWDVACSLFAIITALVVSAAVLQWVYVLVSRHRQKTKQALARLPLPPEDQTSPRPPSGVAFWM